MATQAVVFLGLGSLSDYSDADLRAWNAAFHAHGLRWHWSLDTYAELCRPAGAWTPVERYADFIGAKVDIDSINVTHRKSFAAHMSESQRLRPGVEGVLKWAAERGMKLALLSRRSAPLVYSFLSSTARARGGIEFDAITTSEDLSRNLPFPDGVTLALSQMGVASHETIAISNSPVAAAAAMDAGVATLPFPGRMDEDLNFPSEPEDDDKLVELHAVLLGLGRLAAE